jgi:hypothetical protein
MGLTVLELEVANPASPEVTQKIEFLLESPFFDIRIGWGGPT